MTVLRFLLAVVAALAVSACAREPKRLVVRANMPVALPCIEPQDVPPLPPGLPPMPDDADEALSRALDALLEHRAYAKEADQLLRNCARLPRTP